MFPGINGFVWDAGHSIFLGIFYAVILIVLTTLIRAWLLTARDFKSHREEDLGWHADFEDLPASARACRHELSGEVDSRMCPNRFDCRYCTDHPKFVAARARQQEAVAVPIPQTVAGFELPANRLYHRGHTWVRQEADATLTVGLDDLGTHLMGKPDRVQFPHTGSRVVTNGTGWYLHKNDVMVRVLSPVDGEVIAVGGPNDEWYMKVKPSPSASGTKHLLSVAEAGPWMLREVERLHIALAADGLGAALADGGAPIDDLTKAIPPSKLDDVCGLMFLEP
ncbi:MAG TPA: hypothetical protein VEZ11_08405 [Thermoanaerobaculia bacterium]|nr:hypothetical protein [Thermoanaerobaculia bacterium]